MMPVQPYFSEIFFPPTQNKEAATIPNRSVYVIAAPYREKLLAKEDRSVAGGTACPGTAGDSLLVSRFLPTREKSNYRINLHRTTSAKTRATAKQAATPHTAGTLGTIAALVIIKGLVQHAN